MHLSAAGPASDPSTNLLKRWGDLSKQKGTVGLGRTTGGQPRQFLPRRAHRARRRCGGTDDEHGGPVAQPLLRRRPGPEHVVALAGFIAIGILRLDFALVLLVLVALSIAFAWRRLADANPNANPKTRAADEK
jgi:hypothetical protein